MAFESYFLKYSSNIIKRMRAVYCDESSVNTINIAENKIENCTDEDVKTDTLMNLCDFFHIALWVKDRGSMFLYSNDACNKIILDSDKSPVLNRNGDFHGAKLSDLCMIGDRRVVTENKEIRFIESAKYQTGLVCLDVVKSPLVVSFGEPLGSIGSAVEISSIIPTWVRKIIQKPVSIEIDLDIDLDFEVLNNLYGR